MVDPLNKLKISNRYEPKDKIYEYMIKGAIYWTKFVPLMNSSSAEGQYATDFNNTAPTSTHFTVGPGNSTNHHFQNYH